MMETYLQKYQEVLGYSKIIRYINVDDSIIGKQVSVKTTCNSVGGYKTSFEMINSEGETISTFTAGNAAITTPLFTIPEGTKKIKITGVGDKTALYEIQPYD